MISGSLVWRWCGINNWRMCMSSRDELEWLRTALSAKLLLRHHAYRLNRYTYLDLVMLLLWLFLLSEKNVFVKHCYCYFITWLLFELISIRDRILYFFWKKTNDVLLISILFTTLANRFISVYQTLHRTSR